MYSLIKNVTIEDEIALITLYNLNASSNSIYELFKNCEKLSLNVDMISKTAPLGSYVNLSFTVPQDSMPKILSLTSKYKDDNNGFSTKVNLGNSKITFSGDKLKYSIGVCATVFSIFAKAKADIKIITTSDNEISCLTDSSSINLLSEIIKNEFGFDV